LKKNFLASERGHVKVVELLLKSRGIEVNLKDKDGRTATDLG
jgi:ankyrin repeat protein